MAGAEMGALGVLMAIGLFDVEGGAAGRLLQRVAELTAKSENL